MWSIKVFKTRYLKLAQNPLFVLLFDFFFHVQDWIMSKEINSGPHIKDYSFEKNLIQQCFSAENNTVLILSNKYPKQSNSKLGGHNILEWKVWFCRDIKLPPEKDILWLNCWAIRVGIHHLQPHFLVSTMRVCVVQKVWRFQAISPSGLPRVSQEFSLEEAILS